MGSALKDILGSPAKKWVLVCSCVAIVVGFVAWVVTLQNGLLANSGMSNTFNWGLLIAVFAFLVGFGAGSQFVASYIVLADKQELMRYVPVAQSIALAGGCGAGVAILIDLGNPWHILAMLTGPNPISPLTWDMISLTLFLIFAVICLVAVVRESRHLKVWMALGAVAALALQVVEGLLFALIETRVWWHSFIMPIDFLPVAVVCGLAIAAIYIAVKRRFYSEEAVKLVAKLLVWAIVVHIVLALIDLAIVAFGASAADAATMAALGSVWRLYVLELGLPIVAAVMLLRPSKPIGAAGVITVLGMFCHRLMLLYPAFGSPTLFAGLSNEVSPEWAGPASTGLYTQVGSAFEIAEGYIPNVMEWVSVLLPVGVAAFLVVFGMCAVELHKRMH